MTVEAWQAARVVWPSVEVELAAFTIYVRERAGHCTSDLYLACACAAGDVAAIAAFEAYCIARLDLTLARIGLDVDATAEVKQRVRCRVLVADGRPGRITDYAGRGTLPAWIRVVAVNEARHMARDVRRETTEADLERFHAFATPDPFDAMSLPYRRAFTRAFEHALRSLAPREQVMLRQHVVDGSSVDELGRMHGVHRATAARMIERARRALRGAIKAGMRAELDVGSTELSSIIRSVRPQLDVSLRALRRRLP